MAVEAKKQKPQLVKDFWPRFKRGAIFLIIALQILILIAVSVLLGSFGFFENEPLAAIGALVAQSILGVVASLILYRFVARPVKHLLAALVHVAGEPTSITPPNPNEHRFEKTGFKPVLQTIYQLASDSTDPLQEGTKELAVTPKEPSVSASTDKAFLAQALDASLSGFAIFNKERTLIYSNQATPIRVSPDGITSLDLIFSETDTLDAWWDDCEKNAVHAEKTWPRISNKMPNEENRRFFDIVASYNKESDTEMVITLIDRTYLYSAGEEELDFIAFAAHELRGPITVIRGYLDVLQDELGDVIQPDQKELFHRLTVSANKLSGYINNILNTARFDRRHLKMRPVETTIRDIYESIKDDMELRASSQNRLLSVSIPDALPTIAADTASLGEVLSNLIDNAIKYSNEGGAITVYAASKGDMVEISVEDHGIGMPGSVVSNLFQKFYRSHRSRETVAGTGIGLYISKAIVESHGGTISVRSEDGHGSTFIVSLPTYNTVADRLKTSNNDNQALIKENEGGWIKNHTMYRG